VLPIIAGGKMATQETRGWIWTQQEKDSVTTWKTEVRKHQNRIAEQTKRFRESVPEYASEAAAVSKPFLDLAQELVTFTEGVQRRKYQPFSPETVNEMLNEMRLRLEEWLAFMHGPDVRNAIADANKRIGAQRRAVQKQQRNARKEREELLHSEQFTGILDGHVSYLVKAAADMAALARAMHHSGPFGEEEDVPILERLLLIHFVRSTYESRPANRAALAAFISSTPKPTMEAVLKRAVYLLVEDLLLNPSELHTLLHTVWVLEKVTLYFTVTFQTFWGTIVVWQKEMLTPKSLDHNLFTILGNDYSLESQPK
jgi:hypothetical protein